MQLSGNQKIFDYFSETNHFGGSSFFSNYSKFYVDSGNSEKKWENIFWFCDNSICIGCLKHSLLMRENTYHQVSKC